MTASHPRTRPLTLSAALIAWVLIAVAPGPVAAQGAPAAVDITVDAQPLGSAIVDLARKTGLQVLAPDSVVTGKRAPAISGRHTPEEALELLLADADLTASRAAGGSWVVKASAVGAAGAGGGDVETRTPETILEDSIVVTGSRREQKQSELIRTTAVVDKETLAVELTKTSNVGDVLGRMIPGLGAPSYLDILRVQTLRGREPQYLFDGVPLIYNSGAAFGESPLVNFDPLVVDRIEALYGPTSNYGAGATGGVIQMITRGSSGAPFRLELSQQATTYTQASSPLDDEALSYKTSALASGRVGRVDYLASASYDEQNGVFDGEGDLNNPIFYGFSEDTNYFGKLGVDFTDSQRIEGFYSFVDREYDGRVFDLVVREDGFATGVESASGVPFTYGPDNTPRDEKFLLSVRYSHADVAGGQLTVQYYDREDDIIRDLVDLRGFPLPAVFPDNYQTIQIDASEGLRSQYSRAFGDRLNVLVGFDYEDQNRGSRGLVFELGPDFDLTRQVITPARDDLFGYPFELETAGYFASFDFQATDRLLVSGGLRYEDVEFEIEGGLDIFDFLQVVRPGGFGSGEGTAFNLGFTYQIGDAGQFYANYAEGFEIPSLFFVGFAVPPDQPLESSDAIEPQITDNYEIGFRGYSGDVSVSFAAYYSESEFGQNFIYDPDTNLGSYNRSPERTYGFESVIGWQASADLAITGTLAWTEGDFDPDGDGPSEFVPQTTLDITPWKATLEANYIVSDTVTINGFVLAVGDRDRAFDDGIDLFPIDGYVVADLGVDWALPRGRLLAQVTNLFDNTYLSPASQTYLNNPLFLPRVAGAPGRALSLTYSIDF
ncbi:MAG: TonB-dependent receptor [Acidobacteriota bacterium]